MFHWPMGKNFGSGNGVCRYVRASSVLLKGFYYTWSCLTKIHGSTLEIDISVLGNHEAKNPRSFPVSLLVISIKGTKFISLSAGRAIKVFDLEQAYFFDGSA